MLEPENRSSTGLFTAAQKIRARLTDPPTKTKRAPRRATPPVLVRMMHLALRPESWAESLRYRLRYTLTPLLVAIVLAALASGLATGRQSLSAARKFAAGYDAAHPAMKYEHGKLTVLDQGGAQPLYIEDLRLAGGKFDLIVDPAGKIPSVRYMDRSALIVTADSWIMHVPGYRQTHALNTVAPFATMANGTVIDGEYLSRSLHRHGWALALGMGVALFLWQLILHLLWAAVMIYLLAPVLVLAGAALRMPQRIAYRGTAAVCVPIVLLGAVLAALNVGPERVLPAEYVPIFWFAATALLACWTGVMATHMFKPRKRRRGA